MHVTIVASLTTTDLDRAPPSPSTGAGDGVRLYWRGEDDCQRDAQALARLIQPLLPASAPVSGGSVLIELRGTLGAGKTTFTRHLLRALGVPGRIKSPSYAVVEPHEAPGMAPLWHFDFYRFADPGEWEDAGFRDIFSAPGLKLVEWPDKATGLLPTADLRMDLDIGEHDVRQVHLRAGTPAGQRLLSAWPAASQEGAAPWA